MTKHLVYGPSETSLFCFPSRPSTSSWETSGKKTNRFLRDYTLSIEYSLALTCTFARWLDYQTGNHVWENTNFKSLTRVPLTLPMNWFSCVFPLSFPSGRPCPLISTLNGILLDLKTPSPIYLLPPLPSGSLSIFTHKKESKNTSAIFLQFKYLCAVIGMLVKWCSVEHQDK